MLKKKLTRKHKAGVSKSSLFFLREIEHTTTLHNMLLVKELEGTHLVYTEINVSPLRLQIYKVTPKRKIQIYIVQHNLYKYKFVYISLSILTYYVHKLYKIFSI